MQAPDGMRSYKRENMLAINRQKTQTLDRRLPMKRNVWIHQLTWPEIADYL
ncbi:MAG: hypothetical protein WBS19_09345 [Candidatus Korobacteraceae bacterium]